jgi:hypothetical protein
VLDGKMVFPVVGQALVEHAILLGCDVTRIASPDGICGNRRVVTHGEEPSLKSGD